MTEPNEPPFQVHREQQRDAVIVRASGDLDAFSIDELAEHLAAAEATTTPPAPLLLDLTDVTYLSSAGIATLVIHTKRYAELGRHFRVVADQPAVLRPMALTGADEAIDIAPTLEQAIDAASPG